MENAEIADALDEIASLLEMRGENAFKVRAFQAAARTIAALPEEVRRLVAEDRLSGIKGVGPAISAEIKALVRTGASPLLDDLRRSVPAGLLELRQVPGLGPKKAKALYDSLGVASLVELEYACLENRLVDLKGFGKKSQEKILEGVRFVVRGRGRYLLGTALPEAEAIAAALRDALPGARVEPAGEVRRGVETVDKIGLLVGCDDPAASLESLLRLPGFEDAKALTHAGVTARTASGLPVAIFVERRAMFGVALLQSTADEPFLRALEERLAERDLSVVVPDRMRGVPADEAAAVLSHAGVPDVPPEVWEGAEALEAALRGDLRDLVSERDIRGVFHVHSTWSDGAHPAERMARGALRRGMAFIGLSDHSQAAFYAHGLDAARLAEQRAEVERLRREIGGVRIFHGIEADILRDGDVDMGSETLASLDFVIASVHSLMGMPEEEMTARIVRAVEHPAVRVLGHPTGRLLLGRPGYRFAWERVLRACARRGVALEINANPHRLDADAEHVRAARALGVKVMINPDAHAEEGLDDTRFGVIAARRGFATRDMVLNTRGPDALARELLGPRG